MPHTKCKICNSSFYAKPSHIKVGWGKYCSKGCHYTDAIKRDKMKCFTCGEEIYKTKSQVKKSRSGKLFCSKSCQTKWRNTVFVGKKHNNWKSGRRVNYRKILSTSGVLEACRICNLKDKRVLAVHHTDENRLNNNLNNLAWLCHNCHRLVHCDKVERQRFLESADLPA